MSADEGKAPQLVGKSTLCGLLGWSRPRLDRRLRDDPAFPVAKRGSKTGGWLFDVDDVRTYLGADEQEAVVEHPALSVVEEAEFAEDDKSPSAEFHAPKKESLVHRGEAGAAQRLKAAQAALAEDKLKLSRKELVLADDMSRVLATMLARLGKGLDAMPDRVVRDAALPQDKLPLVREVVDEIRRQMVTDLQVMEGANA